jgi:hypothetical protein
LKPGGAFKRYGSTAFFNVYSCPAVDAVVVLLDARLLALRLGRVVAVQVDPFVKANFETSFSLDMLIKG